MEYEWRGGGTREAMVVYIWAWVGENVRLTCGESSLSHYVYIDQLARSP